METTITVKEEFPLLDIINDIKNEFESIENANILGFKPKEQNLWLKTMGNFIEGWIDVSDISIENLSRVLYRVKINWEDISYEAKSDWKYEFYNWAKKYTKKMAMKEKSKETIDNWISVYRDFSEQVTFQIPEKVYIPKRDKEGNVIDSNFESDNAWISVELDLSNINFSKKLLARGTIRRNQMTPEAWSLFADPNSSVNKLKQEIISIKNGKKPKDKDYYLFESEGIIFINKNGIVCAIARLEFEQKEELPELWTIGIEQLLSNVKIHVPLEYKNE
jgi:hypothetical protein